MCAYRATDDAAHRTAYGTTDETTDRPADGTAHFAS
jgi:hypothetical protein